MDTELIGKILFNALELDDGACRDAAGVVAAALAGRLLPESPQAHAEWSVQERVPGGLDVHTPLGPVDEDEAERWARDKAAECGGEVYRRQVLTWTGDWTPADG